MISVYKDYDDIPQGLIDGKGYKDPSVIQKLREIYHDKCAYCEEKSNSLVIHHYRPKSQYHWLKDEWSNLLLVCQECNVTVKDKFPVAENNVKMPPEDKMQWRSDSKILLAEKPLLLNPEIDTPENHLYVDTNGILMGKTQRGRETIQLFNLNREALIKKREKILNNFLKQFGEQFDQPHEDFSFLNTNDGSVELIFNSLFKDIFQKLQKEAEPESEFSLVAKSILEDFNRLITVPLMNHYFKKENGNIPDRLSNEIRNLQFVGQYFIRSEDMIILDKILRPVPFYRKQNEPYERMKIGRYFAIKSFEIHKYHGIKYTRIENLPINAQWIFLTGENGFGKTLVLQALALGLIGKNDETTGLTDDNCRIKVEWKQEEMNCMNTYGGLSTPLKRIVAYGPARLNIDGDIFAGKQAPGKENKLDSIFQNSSVLDNIQEYLTVIHGRKEFEARYNIIIDTLKKLLPWVDEIIVDDSEAKKKILYRERAENGDILNEIPFGALSAGSKSIIAMVGDILIELWKYLHIGPYAEDYSPANLTGFVIIDEIDIHLHAKWQREFVVRLTELFPKIQFIASTHSPIPLLGAPAETVILHVDKESKKEGIVVKKLDIDVTTLTPNTILSSPIFGFDKILSKAHDRTGPLHTEDLYSDVVFNKILKEKIDQLAREGGKSLTERLKEDQVD